jgi:hypothetical protein
MECLHRGNVWNTRSRSSAEGGVAHMHEISIQDESRIQAICL